MHIFHIKKPPKIKQTFVNEKLQTLGRVGLRQMRLEATEGADSELCRCTPCSRAPGVALSSPCKPGNSSKSWKEARI